MVAQNGDTDADPVESGDPGDLAARLERLTRERDGMARSICSPSGRRPKSQRGSPARPRAWRSDRGDRAAAPRHRHLEPGGRKRLLAAFDQLNAHFGELFARLFGGGKAELAWPATTTRSRPGSTSWQARRASAWRHCRCCRR